MIHDSLASCIGQTPLVYLRRLFPQERLSVIAKLEYLNPGGSMKDRPARLIIERGLNDGTINTQAHLIESTSGNLGIALAIVAKTYGLQFTAVVDPKISTSNMQILRLLGANIDMVTQLDDQGGYLLTRIQRVKELLQSTPNSFWINQYANPLNWRTHYESTAHEILEALDEPVDCLVAAVSTTGTIMGMARRLRERFPCLRVIAVDAVGSVIFGAPAQRREIPGIGASLVPELLCRDEIDDVVYVSDREAALGAQELVNSEGIFAGGSSGAVIAAIQKLLSTLPSPYRILTLLPDRGERYLDTIYNAEWLEHISTASMSHLPS